MARSNTLSNETLPRRSPLHFGDFTFEWELITKKTESKAKEEELAIDVTDGGQVRRCGRGPPLTT
jgi:hypothetical protein